LANQRGREVLAGVDAFGYLERFRDSRRAKKIEQPAAE
jgi:hypothetical protein